MSEREKILRYYRSSGDGDLAARLLDIAESVLRSRKYKISEFLDPHGYSIAETIAAHYEKLILSADGGYSGAERVKVAFVSDEFLGKADFQLSALSSTWDSRYYHITHRDVLGALMSLGIKREVFGDIVMNGPSCQIVLDAAIAQMVQQQLISIGSAQVDTELISLSEIAPREEKVKEIRGTVASMRLDVIAATGFGMSRSKMADEISMDKLKVNWQDAKNSAQSVKVGDIISMRGRGRVEVCEVLGQTKKGRISVLLKRFM